MILSISTSTGYSSSALLDEDMMIVCKDEGFNMQSENLPRNIAGLLAQHNCKFADIKYIAIDIGPGSFTGIRSGVTYTAGIVLPLHNILIIQVETLSALANTMPDIAISMSIIQCHGKRFYAQLFACGKPHIKPTVLTMPDILHLAAQHQCEHIIAPEALQHILMHTDHEFDQQKVQFIFIPLDAKIIGQYAKNHIYLAERNPIISPSYIQDFVVQNSHSFISS